MSHATSACVKKETREKHENSRPAGVRVGACMFANVHCMTRCEDLRMDCSQRKKSGSSTSKSACTQSDSHANSEREREKYVQTHTHSPTLLACESCMSWMSSILRPPRVAWIKLEEERTSKEPAMNVRCSTRNMLTPFARRCWRQAKHEPVDLHCHAADAPVAFLHRKSGQAAHCCNVNVMYQCCLRPSRLLIGTRAHDVIKLLWLCRGANLMISRSSDFFFQLSRRSFRFCWWRRRMSLNSSASQNNLNYVLTSKAASKHACACVRMRACVRAYVCLCA